MFIQTIKCDFCKQIINTEDEEYLTIDTYRKTPKVALESLSDIHFYESCWKEVLVFIQEHPGDISDGLCSKSSVINTIDKSHPPSYVPYRS